MDAFPVGFLQPFHAAGPAPGGLAGNLYYVWMLLSGFPALMALLVGEQIRDDSPLKVLCQGCRHYTERLSEEEAATLARLEGRETHWKAFMCDTCQCILFEDEMPGGYFFPPQYGHIRRDRIPPSDYYGP